MPPLLKRYLYLSRRRLLTQKFLRNIMSDSPAPGLRPGKGIWDGLLAVPEDDREFQQTDYRICYCGNPLRGTVR